MRMFSLKVWDFRSVMSIFVSCVYCSVCSVYLAAVRWTYTTLWCFPQWEYTIDLNPLKTMKLRIVSQSQTSSRDPKSLEGRRGCSCLQKISWYLPVSSISTLKKQKDVGSVRTKRCFCCQWRKEIIWRSSRTCFLSRCSEFLFGCGINFRTDTFN